MSNLSVEYKRPFAARQTLVCWIVTKLTNYRKPPFALPVSSRRNIDELSKRPLQGIILSKSKNRTPVEVAANGEVNWDVGVPRSIIKGASLRAGSVSDGHSVADASGS
jgi:hypothetical protein